MGLSIVVSLDINTVVQSYWEYYQELERDFISTRKYVAFEEDNFSTYSVEYLKLYQAVCSEIDVLGKVMAGAVNPTFKPDDKANSIFKWWYVIQHVYKVYADNRNTGYGSYGTGLALCSHRFLGRIEICPWKDFETEWREVTDKNGNTSNRCLLAPDSSTPSWWSSYNKVKHSRILRPSNSLDTPNYTLANLGNVAKAFAGLFTLEKSLMQAIEKQEGFSDLDISSHIFQ